MYAVIDIPHFSLQAALRLEEGLDCKPVVLVDPALARPLVSDCTPAATRRGVVPGLPVSQAIARCQEIVARHRSLEAEVLAGRTLFDCAYSLSPQVEETFSGVCSIGLAGVDRSRLETRCREIVSDLKGLGLRGRIGIAPTPDLALLVARQAAGVMMAGEFASPQSWPSSSPLPLKTFLDSLPIAAAEPLESLEDILAQWGIRSAGSFVDLPREDVGKRLGREGLDFWDRISGREERPLRVSPPPESYRESLEFEYEIDTLEPLMFILRRFLDSLCLRLKRAVLVAESIHLELGLADIRLEDGERVEAATVSLKVPDPTCDADTLFSMLSTRLQSLDIEAPIVAAGLEIDPVDRNENQLGLFETSLKDPHRFSQTLARLAGIVGPENVGRPCLQVDGRPDGARLERLPAAVGPMDLPGVARAFGLALRRFRPPLDAEVEMRGRKPAWFRCSQAGGAIAASRGPWAQSGCWWEPGGWNRLEWDVELVSGGIYRLVKERAGWTVEGMYD